MLLISCVEVVYQEESCASISFSAQEELLCYRLGKREEASCFAGVMLEPPPKPLK